MDENSMYLQIITLSNGLCQCQTPRAVLQVTYRTGEYITEAHNVLICGHDDISEGFSGTSDPACRFLNQLV